MKLNESLCEFIAAIAIALFVSILVAIWFFQVVASFQQLDSGRHRPVESRSDSANS